MINIIAMLYSLDVAAGKYPNPAADPGWCNEGIPDCDAPYTKQHCRKLCKSNNGNYI